MALEVAQQSPRKPAAIQHYNQAVAYYRQGRLDDAIREFQAALQVEPGNAAIRTGLGWAYERQGHRHQAILEWQRAAKAGSPLARQALAGAGVGLERAQLTPPRAWFLFSTVLIVLIVLLFWGLIPALSPLREWGSSQLAKIIPSTPNPLIAFVSDRDGNQQIYVMDVDGANPRRLTNTDTQEYAIAWSPDGQSIAFSSKRDGNFEIYVMNADGSNPRRLTNNTADDQYPSWSPDGQHIAFQSNRNNNVDIYVMDTDGSNQKRLTSSVYSDIYPVWSPDGQHIAFASDRSALFDIYVMDADGSNQKRLGNSPDLNINPAWSPDGQRIAFSSSRDGNFEIYMMDADGSHARRLTNTHADNFGPSWSPDGQHIVFSSTRDGKRGIYEMDANGSNVRRLTNDSAFDDAPAWRPAPGTKVAQAVTPLAATLPVATAAPSNPAQAVTLPPTWTPQPQSGNVYVVRAGDTLGSIARKFGTTVAAIKALNGLTSDFLQVGQQLIIPEVAATEAPPVVLLPTLTPTEVPPTVEATSAPVLDGEGTCLSDQRAITFVIGNAGQSLLTIDYVINDPAGATVLRDTLSLPPSSASAFLININKSGTYTLSAVNYPLEIRVACQLPTEVPPTNTPVPPTRTKVPPTAAPTSGPQLTGAGTCVADQGTVIFMVRNAGQAPITAEYMVTDPSGARLQVDVLRLAVGDTNTIIVDIHGKSGTYTLTVPIPPLKVDVACQVPTRIPPTKEPPTPVPPTPVPPTKTPLANTSGSSALAVEGACTPDRRTTTFSIVNNGAAMTSDAVYMVTDSSATMHKAGAFRLAAGESTIIAVDMDRVNGVLTLYVPDYQIKVAATCAEPLPTKTPAPSLIGVGLCSNQTATFVVTNNGSDMTASQTYVVKDEAGNVIDQFPITLKSGESRTVTIQGVSGKVTLSIPDAGLLVETVCADPTPTPMTVASGTCRFSGALTVGVDAAYPPFENVNTTTNTIEGFDIDLLNAIGAKLGFTPVYQNTPFDTIFTNLAAGQFDIVISAATITQERSKYISFSNPYFVAGQAIVVRRGDEAQIRGASDLVGKTIGVQLGTTGAEVAKSIKDSMIHPFQTAPEAFQALANKDVDVVINDNAIAYAIVQSRTELNLVVVDKPLTEEYYGIAMRKDCASALVTLNDGLMAIINEGTYATIYRKWMGGEPPKEFQPGGTGIRLSSEGGVLAPADTATPPVLAVAASGGLISFTSRQGDVGSIYVMNSDGTNLRRLTNSDYDEFGAAWSPDGKRIAFFSNAEGHYQMHVVNVDGSDLRRLSNNSDPNAVEFSAAWSPDGQRIAFVSLQNGLMQVYVINADGSNLHRLTDDTSNEVYAAWSPDGKQIVIASDRSGTMHIYLMNADGSNLHRLTNANGTEGMAAWSPDGERIAFELDEKGTSENIQLFVVNADGSNLQRLTNTNGRAVTPSWSPDGQYIAYMSNQDGLDRIYVMNADGSNSHRLTNADNAEYLPAWAPDPARFEVQATFLPSATAGGPPRLSVASNCMPNNEVSFVITNNGGDMSRPALYTLTDETGAPLATSALQLAAGSSMSISGLGHLTLNIPTYSISEPSNCTGAAQVKPTVTGSTAAICGATASRAANVRSAPNVSGAIMDTLSPGQKIEIDGYTQGADGYIWYRRKGGLWVRSDLISVDAGCNLPLIYLPK